MLKRGNGSLSAHTGANTGQTHEGLRSYGWGPFGEGTGAETLQKPAKGGISEQIVDLP